MSFWKKNKLMLILFFVSFILRLLLFLFSNPWNQEIQKEMILKHDALEYHNLAVNLIENKSFAYTPDSPPNILRTPGYPVFIALIYLIFGYLPWVVMIFQNIVSSLTVILLYKTFILISNKKIAFFTALFFGIDPTVIAHTSMIFSETLFVCLLALANYYWIKSIYTGKNISYFIYCAVFFGIATLIRPISNYIFLIVIISYIIYFKNDYKKIIRHSIFFVISFYIVLMPWMLRNYYFYNTTSLSSSSSYNLLLLFVTPIEMQERKISQDSAKKVLLMETDSLIAADGIRKESINDYQYTEYMKKLSFDYIKRKPKEFTKNYINGSLQNFLTLGTSSYIQLLGIGTEKNVIDIKSYGNYFDWVKDTLKNKSKIELVIVVISFIFHLILYLSAIYGIMKMKRAGLLKLGIVYILVIIYFVLLTGPAGATRFKIPMVLFYSLFAGIGFFYFIEKKGLFKNCLFNNNETNNTISEIR